ncbi:hypothetical protein FOMG_19145, partial [Fusarium oxysporum f. sp. melonis 26406]
MRGVEIRKRAMAGWLLQGSTRLLLGRPTVKSQERLDNWTPSPLIRRMHPVAA